MKALFNRSLFQYFDLAKKNNKKRAWFEKNREFYEVSVREPFSILLGEISHRFGHALPGIVIGPRKIARPLRSAKSAETNGIVRASSFFFLSERQTSRFEWNPGIYFQLGDEKEDNVLGMGLYGPSSRQIKRLRKALVEDHETVTRILSNRNLKKYWGGLAPEKYVRFPKDYSPEDPAAKYLWYKQFFFRRPFTRRDATRKDFADTILRSIEAGLPLFTWVRDAIGIYDAREWQRERERERAASEEQEIRDW